MSSRSQTVGSTVATPPKDSRLYGPYMDDRFARTRRIGHIRTMLYTPLELAITIGHRIRARRKAMGLTQADSATRAGVSYRTWRRMESEGKASIDDLVRAALVLRCEDALMDLFPPPAAANMDALLRDQRQARR